MRGGERGMSRTNQKPRAYVLGLPFRNPHSEFRISPYTFPVLIGILSDTHDRIEQARAGMNLLAANGAQFYIHCGDVGGEQILDLFAGLPGVLVWGNNDWDRQGLGRYADSLGVKVQPSLAEVELDARQFAVTHGDDARLVQQLLAQQRHDYLLVGHSHIRADRRQGRVRIINPGALHRAAEKSVALLNLATDELRFLRI